MMYSSLRYGAFLLAYAPLESFFTQLTRYAERANGCALPLNLDKTQRELDLQWPDARFQANPWEGRTRQQPTRRGSRSEWVHLKGGCLNFWRLACRWRACLPGRSRSAAGFP
jgi:hypothetical protein